jgi:hypothetical protein
MNLFKTHKFYPTLVIYLLTLIEIITRNTGRLHTILYRIYSILPHQYNGYTYRSILVNNWYFIRSKLNKNGTLTLNSSHNSVSSPRHPFRYWSGQTNVLEQLPLSWWIIHLTFHWKFLKNNHYLTMFYTSSTHLMTSKHYWSHSFVVKVLCYKRNKTKTCYMDRQTKK